MGITVERKLAEGLYVVWAETIRGVEGRAMWTLRKLRKKSRCVETGKTLNAGEQHYGPIGNMDYRGWRVDREFIETSPVSANES